MVSVCMPVVLGTLVLIRTNVIWFIVDILCIAMLVIPYTRNLGYRYNKSIIAISFIALTIAFIVHIINYTTNIHDDMLLDVNTYVPDRGLRAYQYYPIGLMLAVFVDRNFGIMMTKMSSIVFTLAFAMTLLTVMCSSPSRTCTSRAILYSTKTFSTPRDTPTKS